MSTAWESLANEPILDIHPYQPGKPIEELERELGIPGAVKLASNENPYGPPAGVLEALRQALAGLNRYPDGSGYYLRQALAKKHGVSAESIVLGNGSNELIELLARAFVKHGEEVVIPHPSFVVYPSIVQAAGGIRVVVALKDHRLDLPKMRRAVTGLTKMVFVANPNNPTGTIVTAEEVSKFLDRMPEHVIVVFDEAYYDFAAGPDFPDALAHLREGKRVVILRTFSKMASLAGLRVGYAVADPDCIQLMNRIRQPFNVNTLAQVAALAALHEEPHIRSSVEAVREGMRRITTALDAMGVSYVPSRANFLLVELPDAARVYEALLKHGVIVRPMASFGLERALRITVGTPEENARLVEALRQVLGKGAARP
ncbi:MAG TPA: histidinol-phosphate transaminase [Methylomirabilota bacterium]|jgi:histidinol-phosphate aminotransferase